MLAELVRKRETQKLKQAQIQYDVISSIFYPHMAKMRHAFEKISAYVDIHSPTSITFSMALIGWIVMVILRIPFQRRQCLIISMSSRSRCAGTRLKPSSRLTSIGTFRTSRFASFIYYTKLFHDSSSYRMTLN